MDTPVRNYNWTEQFGLSAEMDEQVVRRRDAYELQLRRPSSIEILFGSSLLNVTGTLLTAPAHRAGGTVWLLRDYGI